MAYSIYKSDGSFLTSIADGTINTTSTSIGLPGRNYAGYGQIQDTAFVHIIENFADSTPPDNPLEGQLWYDTSSQTVKVAPSDNCAANAWVALASAGGSGTTTFGNVAVTGTMTAGNIYANSGTIGAATVTTANLTVTTLATIGNANITLANVGTVNTTTITSGANTAPGNIFGTWTLTGGNTGLSLTVANGNVLISNANPSIGIKCDNYMYSNGDPLFSGGTPYGNTQVQAYLQVYNGNIGGGTATFKGTTLTTGSNVTGGTITGNWTLSSGSKLQATYADLAERFAADDILEPGTVVELGGEKEITAVKYELSEDVFGVISNTAAYLMNAGAGSDESHPPVAVSGRVQVKVNGTVKKGDRLVSAGNGIARAAKDGEANAFNTIGRALTNKVSEGLGFVEAIVMIR